MVSLRGDGVRFGVRKFLLLAPPILSVMHGRGNRDCAGSQPVKEEPMYAAIRQAKSGMAEELARRINEGAVPIKLLRGSRAKGSSRFGFRATLNSTRRRAL
jgi:hypothetical protein